MRVSNRLYTAVDVAKSGTRNMSSAFNGPSSTSPFTLSLIATPDWRNAYVTWQWAWQIHVYTIATIFYILSLFCLLSLLRGRKRLRKKKPLGLILGFLFLTGAFRGTYFVLDPYGSQRLLPIVVRQLLFDSIYPCLTTCYSVIQMMILKITKVDVGPTKIANKRFLVGVTSLYFASLTAVEITVGIRPYFRLLLLVPHGFFITWSMYLCVTFIYNGFKLMHYVAEIKKARKELSSYSLAKRSCSNENFMTRSVTIQRLNKPQIRITDEDNQTYSIVSDDESTISDLNEMSVFQPNTINSDLKKIASKVGHMIDQTMLIRSQSTDVHFLMDDSNGTETTAIETPAQEMCELRHCDTVDIEQIVTSDAASMSGSVNCGGGNRERDDERCGMVNILCPQLLQQQHSQSKQYHQLHQLNHIHHQQPNIYSKPPNHLSHHNHDSNHSSHQQSFKHINCEDSLDDETEFKGCANTFRAGWCSISALLHRTPSTDITEGDESFLVDNGYMADTEVPSSNSESKKYKHCRRKCSADQSDPRDADSVETPLPLGTTWHPQLLASSPSTLSLHRIRQSRMLHRVMHLTYFTTFLLIVACLFQLYALFGIYGLFSRISNPDPWPWLIFQSFYRLTEFGMGTCMAGAVHLIISHKIRTSTNRKGRYKLFESIEDIWKRKSLM